MIATPSALPAADLAGAVAAEVVALRYASAIGHTRARYLHTVVASTLAALGRESESHGGFAGRLLGRERVRHFAHDLTHADADEIERQCQMLRWDAM